MQYFAHVGDVNANGEKRNSQQIMVMRTLSTWDSLQMNRCDEFYLVALMHLHREVYNHETRTEFTFDAEVRPTLAPRLVIVEAPTISSPIENTAI